MSAQVGTPPSAIFAAGRLPDWTPYAAMAAAGAVSAPALLAAGAFSIFLFLLVTGALATSSVYVISRVVEDRRQAKDRLVTAAIASAFVLAILPLLSLLFTVVTEGAARFDVAFFTESLRGVIGEGGGGFHAIVGTLVITAVATVISVPVGIMAAIYLNEYGKGPLARWLTFFVDVMTGIPSIVAGLFAFALFAAFFGPGIRLGVMGSVALSVLMIPIVIRATEEMLKIVPNHLREASYALGTPKWKTVTKVVVPTALGGIVTGVMLAIARIVGETAPLLVTTGVLTSTNANPFDGRMQNLAVFAFYEYKSPGVPPEPSIERAWTAALTLIAIVMILSLLARLVYRRYGTEVR